MLLFAQLGKLAKEESTIVDHLIEAVMPSRGSIMAQAVGRAVDRGEIGTDKLTERIANLPADLFRLELIMTGRPLSNEAAEEIVATVILLR